MLPLWFTRILALSRAFFTFLLYKPELLLNLLFLLSLRCFLACFFRCNGKFLVHLRFLRNLRTSRGPSLPLYRSKSELSLNLLFLRYLIACLPCCNEKYCLLLQFFPNLRLSRGSSLPSFFMIVHDFAKAVVFTIFSISVTKGEFQNTADKIMYDFYQFMCYRLLQFSTFICHSFYTCLQAVSIKHFLFNLRQTFASKFFAQVLQFFHVEFVILAIFSISSAHFCKQFPLHLFLLKLRNKLLANA